MIAVKPAMVAITNVTRMSLPSGPINGFELVLDAQVGEFAFASDVEHADLNTSYAADTFGIKVTCDIARRANRAMINRKRRI